MTREERQTIKKNIAAAVEAHQQNRANGPRETVTALIEGLGYGAARETIAAMINTVGEWDGRISPTCRTWAADIGPTRDELREASIYQPSEIHPAHLDQIAREMMSQPEPERCEVCGEYIAEGEEFTDDLGRRCCEHCYAERCHEQGYDQPSEAEKKLEALKVHIIEEEEATAEELAPCTVENTYNPNWDTFEIIGREYRVMTEDEADAAARESILDYAWAFNPEFVLRHTAFYETSTPSDDRTFCDALRRLQRDLCESAAPLIRALIRDPDEFVRDAIAADGRGHFLSPWDGEEYESGPYLIYRTN